MFTLSNKSREHLQGVHPDLIKVVERALELTTQDFSVNEGVRSLARQQQLYAQGRTAPGKIVTWTMKSNHFEHRDGYGHAVDLINYPLDYSANAQFMAIAHAMKLASSDLDIAIRWGGDWDMDNVPMEKGETDIGHFELTGAKYV